MLAAYLLITRDGRGTRAAAARTPATGATGATGAAPSIASNLSAVVAHARTHPRFALILLIGSVVRTDSVILGAFVALWVVNAGRLQGIDAITATRTVGLLSAIRLMTTVVGLLAFGPIADRTNRVRLVLIAVALTATGFLAFGLVGDVFGVGMIAVTGFIGLAEGAQSIASQSLIAEEAPQALRGSAMGVFAFLGTASLMVVNLVGGRLFDRAGFASPMVMEGVLHLCALGAALALIRRPTLTQRSVHVR
jgi:MFS family permease